jgi:DNA-binding MarR family transcriptional regulator
MGLLEKDKVVVFAKTIKSLSLDDVKGRVVMMLHKEPSGMSGSQLAKDLGVSQAAISKAANELIDLGILRKEPLAAARNVKVYYLSIKMIGDKEIADLQKRIPRVLKDAMLQRFGGQERLGLIFADQVMRFLASVKRSEAPGILQEYMRLSEEEAKIAKDVKDKDNV